jgi:hypothetical protein
MRFGWIVGFSLLALAPLTAACASTPEPLAVDPSSDPSWIPPGQGDLDVPENADAKAPPKKAGRPRRLEKPNTSDKGSLGIQARNN